MKTSGQIKNFRKSVALLCLALPALILFGSCGHKPKAVSKDYTKVRVTENGHKDSVIDNKQRLYNASIPEPCLQCVIAAIRTTELFRKQVSSADSAKIVYQVDWASGPKLRDSLKKAGSGMLVHVLKKNGAKADTLAVFTFDNVAGQLFGAHGEPVKLDSASRLRIRNACFWGVASGK